MPLKDLVARAQYRKAYYQKNRESLVAKNRARRKKNAGKAKKPLTGEARERLRACARRGYRRDPARIKRNKDRWRKSQGGRLVCKRARRRRYLKWTTTDRIVHRARTRIQCAVARQSTRKYQRTVTLLGCTPDQLIVHLEARFKPGMSWDNRGLWHIDHIKPCASFDLADPEQQKVCFHYTNLQPLWAGENMKKGAKAA